MSVSYEASVLAAQTVVVLCLTIGIFMILVVCCACLTGKKQNKNKLAVSAYKKMHLTTMSTLLPMLHQEDELNPLRKCIYYKFNTLTEANKESTKFLGLNEGECDEFLCMEIFLKSLSFIDVDMTVILHISSPGGESYKFEKLYDIISSLKAKENLSIIAFVDDICASGGYMIACACHEIVCTQTSLIGSIGVYCTTFNASDFAGKVGFKELVFKTTAVKGGISTFGEYSEDDRNAIKTMIDYTFAHFKKIVLENRPLVDMDKVATAETWYGTDALDLKLVDKNMSYYEFMKSFQDEVTICSFKATEKKKSGISKLLTSYNNFSHFFSETISEAISAVVSKKSKKSPMLLV